MTPDEAYALGRKLGREQVLDEIVVFLKLDERIAKAIELHEEQRHGDDNG